MHLKARTQSKLALGSDVVLTFVSGVDDAAANELFNSLWEYTYNFERRFSRFLPVSELSQFNRSAGIQRAVSEEFGSVLAIAKELGVRTGGLYNPFILPALQKAGYVHSAVKKYANDTVDDYSARQVVAVEQLQLGLGWASIPYGTAVDLGGCGKGYLADRLGDMLIASGVHGFWLSLGGDIATYGLDEQDKPITLAIQDAQNLNSKLDWEVHCPSERFAVATSGTFRRPKQGLAQGWHHIIEPTTLKPALTDVKLATICAPTGVVADVLASCAILFGSKKGVEGTERLGATAGLLQCYTPEVNDFIVNFGSQIVQHTLAFPKLAEVQYA